MKRYISLAAVLVLAAFLYSCSEQPPVVTDQSSDNNQGAMLAKSSVNLADFYLVEYSGSETDFQSTVEGLGGEVDNLFPGIKTAQVSRLTDKSAVQLKKEKGVKSVTQDMFVQWVEPIETVSSESIGDDEPFWFYQWGPRVINAPAAWDAGYTGAGVRVAVIDGGISSNHLDLDDNIDFSASASFYPGFDFDDDTPGFRHASHVAGIIAAEDNEIGTIGVAPNATIIALKALHDGSGAFSFVISAILYAAETADADIINMSLGAVYPRNNKDAAQLNSLMNRAMNYASQKGVTIVVSAGNNAIDFDHAYMYVHMPSEATHVINVSATGPVDFAYGATNFDRPASYTNYGQSVIDFAAPGGDFTSPNPLWYLDMVLSPSFVDGPFTYWSFAAGTSMAAPHVAGVAALILEANGGELTPAQVKAIMKQSADDLGKPGKDDYYGMGRVNAGKAVGQ